MKIKAKRFVVIDTLPILINKVCRFKREKSIVKVVNNISYFFSLNKFFHPLAYV
jgi:hypothetical protein